MINTGIIASRHRDDYFRRLSSVNNDRFTSTLDMGGSNIIIEFDAIIENGKGVYFITRGGVTNTGFLARIRDDLTANVIVFGVGGYELGAVLSSTEWRTFRFEINVSMDNQARFYENNSLVGSSAIGSINTGGDSNLVIDSIYDSEIDNLKAKGAFFKMNEDTGFDCASSTSADTLFGQTANAGGLTYWENNVIEKRN